MSVIVEADTSSSFTDDQSSVNSRTVLNTSDSLNNSKLKITDSVVGQNENDKSKSESPTLHPMAFTINFGQGKPVDKQRLEQLAKQSQARHQRVQSMSASLTRPSPIAQKPPLSAKLPRKAQGYNSEGYFSSDQEDSILSGSVKLRQSPLTQNKERHIPTSPTTRHPTSPVTESFQSRARTSKSPIVDSIMSRSDILPSRQSLNLPLKQTTSSYIRDVHRTPSYGNLSSSYHPCHTMADIIDQSPEGIMLTDISSPELDILTPDNGLSTPDNRSPSYRRSRRTSSNTPDLLLKPCSPKSETLYIDDDELDRQSNNSSTGTYTIEGDNYTAEQKARMSIDRTFGANILDNTIDEMLKKRNERDPELIFDCPKAPKVITKEPRRETDLRSPVALNQTFGVPTAVSKDKNVLEISCCYESPTDTNLAAQTSKQIKSTRSYLEKIKNRVRTITEKTFAKSPPKVYEDEGNFTSVTTSGVLSSKNPPKLDLPVYRRCSLAKSEIDQTDYIHRLSRESSVPVCLMSNTTVLVDEPQFESTVLRNAHAKTVKDDSGVSSDITPEAVVGKLSYLSLNRCKGDKAWIQDWADSVKKYNNTTQIINKEGGNATFLVSESDLPPPSPRHLGSGKYVSGSRVTQSSSGTPTKIPSPISTLHLRAKQNTVPMQDTETYLQKTQNAISNLQAKLQSSRGNDIPAIPSQLTSSLISEKTLVSRLPVSQLSRSNSLNYRLRRKDHSSDSSPLRSPGHYVITGSTALPDARIVLNNSRSLETEKRRVHDFNMNSPCSDGLLSCSSDDKTLSNRPYVEAIVSPHRTTHARHKSFDLRVGNCKEHFGCDTNNANSQVSLKTVLKNNALESQLLYVSPRSIDKARCQGDGTRSNHQRVSSDTDKGLRRVQSPNSVGFGTSIKRSSSFSTVNKNNNYLEPVRTAAQRKTGLVDVLSESKRVDYLSDESDNGSVDKSDNLKYKRSPTQRGKIQSPETKSKAPANSPKCPNTPEMPRKFGPGLVRHSNRVTSKERVVSTRMSEPPASRDDRQRQSNHQSRRISEPTRQAVLNRLTKSKSSTREFQPKVNDKGARKPTQYRSSSALATKEIEFSNWKKRSSYDPMKSAMEGRKRHNALAGGKRQECNKDDLSSPSHSSPVHRSQSFHSTNMADLETLDYSSEGTEDERMVSALPVDHPMITSTHSDILDLRPKGSDYRETLRRQAMNNDVVLARDYVADFRVNKVPEKNKHRDIDKRKTFIIDDITPTKENVDFLKHKTKEVINPPTIDKRNTFILDSDTNSTTNGSSPRNSSIFSHEKHSLTTGTSDTEGESGTESAPVQLRHNKKPSPTTAGHRHSGDYSMSSSTTSASRDQSKRPVQPRYLDISRYKPESSPRCYLRRDPSKTYVGVLPAPQAGERHSSKANAKQLEMEQKKQELEKWKRRASYDPRKSAALGKTAKTPVKTLSSVLRSQSFHGPVLSSTNLRYHAPTQIAELYDQSSDNDF